MIGAQVLIGDNPEPFLEAALRSVSWVDYYTVVCMTDEHGDAEPFQRNKETVERVVPAAKLRYEFFGYVDFGAARNLALQAVPDGDFVMILDADDVHYPEWEGICQWYLVNGADSITAAFYHFMVYRNAYQAVYPREIVFRKGPETQFVGAVHEQLHTRRDAPATADYRYAHYGYLKPQREIFARWKRYSDMVGDFHHYDGQNPDHIVDDRVSVSSRFTLEHPPAVRDVIEGYPVCPVPLQGEARSAEPLVGLVLLAKDDDGFLPGMFESLARTHGVFDLAMFDIGSSDDTHRMLVEVTSPRYSLSVLPAETSLTEALNRGFRWFLDRGYDYIGWIHPDALFDEPDWLVGLLHEFRCWPKVGKVCAANTRDKIPEQMIEGHEQIYLMRASVLREVGLFDESFVGIGGYEDFDMNRRVLNAGYRCVITPRSRVYHLGMGTRSRRDTTADQIANANTYACKWGNTDAPV